MTATRSPGVEPAGPFGGRNAVVTGAASGIGRAIARELCRRGAQVLALDLQPSVAALDQPGWNGMVCDVTQAADVGRALMAFVESRGPLDFLVSNAGTFPAGAEIADLDLEVWDRSLQINLTSHLIVLQRFIHLVRPGEDSAVVVVGSRNVAAPGPGAAAYSAPKAALTQLARIAAMELGPRGIRVNVVHPDAIFDTALWTPEALERSAERYGVSVEEYKHQNVLGAEIGSDHVAQAACALLDSTFSRTTGAQIPVDGGNMRVI